MHGAVLRHRAEWTEADGEPPLLKRQSRGARALIALAQRFGPHPTLTGLYQALGREKLELTSQFAAEVQKNGFAQMKATDPVLRYSGYGPFVSLALALGCRGPFWTVEADGLAGGAALQQAVTDLRLGRCERALVGSCDGGGNAWLLVLDATEAANWSLSLDWREGEGARPAADDLHGLRALGEALERAQRAEPSTVRLSTPEGRCLLVSVRLESGA
jgi:hypothetical protein